MESICRVAVSLVVFVNLILNMVPLVKAQGGEVTLNPIDDTYAYFYDTPSYSHGTEPELKVSQIIYVSFLKFSLSSIPQGASGFTAILELYCSYASEAGTYPAYLCLNNTWSEETLNHYNLPSWSGDLYLDSKTVSAAETWHSWIVTAAVENVTSRNVTRVTIMVGDFSGHSPSPLAYFNSREAGTYAPKLTISWTAVPELPSFLILPLFVMATLLPVIVFKRKRGALHNKSAAIFTP